LIANRLAYFAISEIEALLKLTTEVGRMLAGLTKRLREHLTP
jgi:hypothetical protein